jgi:hypothetical protein
MIQDNKTYIVLFLSLLINTGLFAQSQITKPDITKEDDLIKAKYTTVVDAIVITLKNIDSFPRQNTYYGFVTTKQKLENTIKAVTLETDLGIVTFPFEYNEHNGKICIAWNDRKYGKITHKGNLILLDSHGNEVAIPFSFSYYNEKPKPDKTIEVRNGVTYIWLRGEKHQQIRTSK